MNEIEYPEILAYIAAFEIVNLLDRHDLTDREKPIALALALQALEQRENERVASVPAAPLPRDSASS